MKFAPQICIHESADGEKKKKEEKKTTKCGLVPGWAGLVLRAKLEIFPPTLLTCDCSSSGLEATRHVKTQAIASIHVRKSENMSRTSRRGASAQANRTEAVTYNIENARCSGVLGHEQENI